MRPLLVIWPLRGKENFKGVTGNSMKAATTVDSKQSVRSKLFLFQIIQELPNRSFNMCAEEALLEDFETAVSLEDDVVADLVQNFQELSPVQSCVAPVFSSFDRVYGICSLYQS